MLVSNGGNIYAENSKGFSPLSLVRNKTLRADMVFLTRKPLLLLFAAISITNHLKHSNALQRVAENIDLRRYIVGFS